ncbi:hypothetical protein GWK47_028453 [Chionoecetes opilio]|uniref:Uncharacterized protein n=1 Tax=Chionoecetes opilio TaxID=41210 RepID=A0A8J5D631_CHIOP|nr:hypothetical protein GWK47_028453 [Chionoecetes opilio]
MAVRCKHHPRPLPLSTVKRLKSRVCRFTWDTSLGDALRATTMVHGSDSSPHPWIRETFRFLDVSLTRLRAAATQQSRPTCTAKTSRYLSPDPSLVQERPGVV